MFVHTYFARRYFPNRYFPGPGPLIPPQPPPVTVTGGAFAPQRIPAVQLFANLVIPAPELKALVVVTPSHVTVQAAFRVPSLTMAVDWQVFEPTSASGYPRKQGRTQEQDEAEALLEHYMLTLAAWAKKGK